MTSHFPSVPLWISIPFLFSPHSSHSSRTFQICSCFLSSLLFFYPYFLLLTSSHELTCSFFSSHLLSFPSLVSSVLVPSFPFPFYHPFPFLYFWFSSSPSLFLKPTLIPLVASLFTLLPSSSLFFFYFTSSHPPSFSSKRHKDFTFLFIFCPQVWLILVFNPFFFFYLLWFTVVQKLVPPLLIQFCLLSIKKNSSSSQMSSSVLSWTLCVSWVFVILLFIFFVVLLTLLPVLVWGLFLAKFFFYVPCFHLSWLYLVSLCQYILFFLFSFPCHVTMVTSDRLVHLLVSFSSCFVLVFFAIHFFSLVIGSVCSFGLPACAAPFVSD